MQLEYLRFFLLDHFPVDIGPIYILIVKEPLAAGVIIVVCEQDRLPCLPHNDLSWREKKTIKFVLI